MTWSPLRTSSFSVFSLTTHGTLSSTLTLGLSHLSGVFTGDTSATPGHSDPSPEVHVLAPSRTSDTRHRTRDVCHDVGLRFKTFLGVDIPRSSFLLSGPSSVRRLHGHHLRLPPETPPTYPLSRLLRWIGTGSGPVFSSRSLCGPDPVHSGRTRDALGPDPPRGVVTCLTHGKPQRFPSSTSAPFLLF